MALEELKSQNPITFLSWVPNVPELLPSMSVTPTDTGSWSKRRQVITATGENGESQNGDKPYNECKCVCVDDNAVSITVVVHLRHLNFYPW